MRVPQGILKVLDKCPSEQNQPTKEPPPPPSTCIGKMMSMRSADPVIYQTIPTCKTKSLVTPSTCCGVAWGSPPGSLSKRKA